MVNNLSPHAEPREMAAKGGAELRKSGETLKVATAAIAP